MLAFIRLPVPPARSTNPTSPISGVTGPSSSLLDRKFVIDGERLLDATNAAEVPKLNANVNERRKRIIVKTFIAARFVQPSTIEKIRVSSEAKDSLVDMNAEPYNDNRIDSILISTRLCQMLLQVKLVQRCFSFGQESSFLVEVGFRDSRASGIRCSAHRRPKTGSQAKCDSYETVVE